MIIIKEPKKERGKSIFSEEYKKIDAILNEFELFLAKPDLKINDIMHQVSVIANISFYFGVQSSHKQEIIEIKKSYKYLTNKVKKIVRKREKKLSKKELNKIGQKKCHICKDIKLHKEFYKSKTTKDGFHSYCKICFDTKYFPERMKICVGCGELKHISEYFKHPGFKDGLQSKCKICYAKKNKPDNIKKCKICGKEKFLKSFKKISNKPNIYSDICKNCETS